MCRRHPLSRRLHYSDPRVFHVAFVLVPLLPALALGLALALGRILALPVLGALPPAGALSAGPRRSGVQARACAKKCD